MVYDSIKHAKILVKSDGICDGHFSCDVCFRRTCGVETFGCSPEDAYEDALKFLGENDNRGKCVSIW